MYKCSVVYMYSKATYY